MSAGTPRAALYALVTPADGRKTVEDEQLPMLRRLAEQRGWSVASEYRDALDSLQGRRPGFLALQQALDRREADLVVTESLVRLFATSAQLARVAHAWLAAGLDVVACRELVDTTDLAGRGRLLEAVRLFDGFQRGLSSANARLGYIRRAQQRDGSWGRGLARAVVNPLELRSYWDQGLSLREIEAKLRKAGGGVSRTTIAKHVADLLAQGFLAQEARQEALGRRGGLRTGGRPRKRVAVDEAQIRQLWEAGASVAEILRRARVTRGRLTRSILRRLLDEIQPDPEARRRALAADPRSTRQGVNP